MKSTVKEALEWASFCLREASINNPRAEAELLLASVLRTDRLRLLANNLDLLADEECRQIEVVLKRRVNHEPLAYITGEKYFYGRRFVVNRDVLIPRPETELIVEQALKWVKISTDLSDGGLRIIDLGTGSGILAITLALELPSAEVIAVDISPAALQIARQNASLHNLEERVNFFESSYFDLFDRYCRPPFFNLIVSNPPYISHYELEDLPPSVANYEPRLALDGGVDGLASYRAIMKKLPAYIVSPALVVVEIGSTQNQAVSKLFIESSLFRMIGCRRDLANHPRVILGLI